MTSSDYTACQEDIRPSEEISNPNALVRSAAALCYMVKQSIHWLSPTGRLKEWLRTIGEIAVMIAAPVFLIFPSITFAISQLVAWVSGLVVLFGKLILLPILILISAFAIWITKGMIQPMIPNSWYSKRKKRSQEIW